MFMTRWGVLALAVLLGVAMTAEAALISLYSDDDYQYFGPAANGKRRSQHFSPTQSSPNTLADPSFDSAGMWFETDELSTVSGTLELYTWTGDPGSSVGGTPIASSPVNLGTGYDGYIDLLFAPQPASGQYFISFLVGTVTGQDFGLRRSASDDGGTNNDAFNDTGIKTDREYQVRLNGVPEPATLALIALGVPFLVRRKR
jgi:hypothetical protein